MGGSFDTRFLLITEMRGNKTMKKTIITIPDRERLIKLIDDTDMGRSDRRRVEDLEAKLKSSHVVASKTVPPDVITMNSEVLLWDSGEANDLVYSLVYPDNADIMSNRISVLAPVGTAILGGREGDTIEWDVPGGTVRVSIKKILYQPEAAGDFEL
jgi:regulator of nucleoside diphosphate kinase